MVTFRLDDNDKRKRDFERIKRRKERWSKRPRSNRNILNPYGLEKRDLSMCSRIVNDDMDFYSDEQNERLFRVRVKDENIPVFDFSEHSRLEISWADVGEITQNKKRRS